MQKSPAAAVLALSVFTIACAPPASRAENSRPIRLMTGIAGGGYDGLGRAMADAYAKSHAASTVEVVEGGGSVSTVEAIQSGRADAMFAPFVSLVIGLGAPPKLAVYAFACLAALPAGLTHYGTTTAPMFINGYVTVKDWWRVGLICSFANLAVWLTVGFGWWKVLGFW